MKKTIGKVIEVYIPEQYKNNNLLDVMDRNLIGFKVMTEEGLKVVETEQNEENATIIKKDIVEIIEQTISNVDFIDIRPYGGDING
jgi:hypothetical protein